MRRKASRSRASKACPRGDIILAVGRNSVGTIAALDRELAALKPGDSAMLLVQRGGSSRYIAVSPRPAAAEVE